MRLKGGDPFVFGRGGEEAEALAAAGIAFEVIPGVTSAVAAPAYAGIPVTHRGLASSFAVVTGHEDPETKADDASIDWPKLATGVDTLVFLMGVGRLAEICARLIEHGRAASTPVAVVEWGTLPRQRTVAGTLATIAAAVAAAGIGSPAVTVVGEVARLRDDLRWFDARPLSGKRVLVTRTRQQASELSRLLAAAGAEPVELPALEIARIADQREVARCIDTLHTSGYGWAIFTSANGVDIFFEELAAAQSRRARVRPHAGRRHRRRHRRRSLAPRPPRRSRAAALRCREPRRRDGHAPDTWRPRAHPARRRRPRAARRGARNSAARSSMS